MHCSDTKGIHSHLCGYSLGPFLFLGDILISQSNSVILLLLAAKVGDRDEKANSQARSGRIKLRKGIQTGLSE